MTICKDITMQNIDVDRYEFITDGKLAIRRNDPIPPDINAVPLEYCISMFIETHGASGVG